MTKESAVIFKKTEITFFWNHMTAILDLAFEDIESLMVNVLQLCFRFEWKRDRKKWA